MLRLRKIKPLFILAVVFAFAVSCSNDEEVIEQQEPQTQISEELKQSLILNSTSTVAAQQFQSNINWYEGLSVSSDYCDIDIAVLAYGIYDTNDNSLYEINVVPWIAEQGFTFDDITNELEQIGIQIYGEDIQVIFVAGILVKIIDDEFYELAEITNYATFNDYFDDCESTDVTFEVMEGTYDFDFDLPPADEVDFPDTPAPCTTLDFPLDIVVADEANLSVTFEETVDEIEFIDYLQGNLNGFVFVDFVYPVSLTLNNGTQVLANNAGELSAILNDDCE